MQINTKKPHLKRAAMLSPSLLALAACGGGGTGGGGLYSDGKTPLPYDSTDDGRLTVVVLDYYTGPDGYHGDFVEATLDKQTDVHIIGVDRAGRPAASETDNLLAEVNVAHDPEVINMSTAQVYTTTSTHQHTTSTTTVIQDLFEQGVVVVASSGNSGAYGASFSRNQSELDITVGATYKDGSITSYSNYHPEMVDFYALGTSEPLNHLGFSTTLSGTSFSSPRVAGMVAEILEENPEYTMSEIRTILELNSEYLVHDDGEGHVFVYQFLDGLDTVEHTINTRVIVEAGFELFENMNPTQDLLDQWVFEIDSGAKDYVDLEQYFEETTFDGYTLGVAAVEKAQAFYHWNYHRESTDRELLDMLPKYNSPEFGRETTNDIYFGVEEIGIIQTPEEILHAQVL